MRRLRTAIGSILFQALIITASASEVPFGSIRVVDGQVYGAHTVVSADLDRDGDLDLLGASADSGEVRWWENEHGDASSWIRRNVATGCPGAWEVTWGDVDLDGDPDLLGATYSVGELRWWENDGHGGTWTEHLIHSSPHGAGNLAAADLDRDGDLDVVGGDEAYSLDWWENLDGMGGSWALHPVTVYGCTGRRVVRDMDGDGWNDIVTVTFGGSSVDWWENPAGSGGDWTRHNIDPDLFKALEPDVADLDRDGDLDVMATSCGLDVLFYENLDGAGISWAKHILYTHAHSYEGVRARDIDQDGDLDLVTAESYVGEISWLENAPQGWTAHLVYTDLAGLCWSESADLDGDGDPDLVAASYGGDGVYWWENRRIHRSAAIPAFLGLGGMDARSVTCADVDRDGDPDLLSSYPGGASLFWWENQDGQGQTWQGYLMEDSFSDADRLSPVDLDDDGDPDLLGAAFLQDTVAWWENPDGGGTWTRQDVDTDFDTVYWTGSGDLDGDGDPDVVVAGQDGVAWYANDGSGQAWIEHPITAWSHATYGTAIGDLDRDGDLDLAVSGYLTGDQRISWLENLYGDGSDWSPHLVLAGQVAESIVVRDVNRDGLTDLVTGIPALYALHWYENVLEGAGWTQHVVDDAALAVELAVEDLDGDGDWDILGGHHDMIHLTRWENLDGVGGSWSDEPITTGPVGSPHMVDVDRDGMLDLVGVFADDSFRIGWWRNRGGQFAFPVSDAAPPWALDGQEVDMLRMMMHHRGWSDDSEEELAELRIFLQDGAGLPLTETHANALIERIRVYRDEGMASDRILVQTVEVLTLNPLGELSVPFPDGDPDVRIQPGSPAEFLITAEIAAGAASLTPAEFRFVHYGEWADLRSRAEDRSCDIALQMEHSPDLASSIVHVLAGTPTPSPTTSGTPTTPTATPTLTRTPTFTPTSTPTPTLTASPTATPPPTASPSSTRTPIPTRSPIPTPSPTAIPETPTATPLQELWVELRMPDHHFTPGEIFRLDAHIEDPDAPETVPFFCLLDLFGTYYFYPSWVRYPPEVDWADISLEPGANDMVLIPPFLWPAAGGPVEGIRFHGAVLNATMDAVRGRMDSVEWGYGP